MVLVLEAGDFTRAILRSSYTLHKAMHLLLLLLMLHTSVNGRSYDLSHVQRPTSYILETFPVPRYTYTTAFKGTFGPHDVFADLGSIEVAEHSGTHIDAPNHFIQGGKSLDELTIDMTVGPGVVVDCTEEVLADQTYVMPTQKLLDWEKEHGRIPQKAAVVVKFGWSQYFTNHTALKGSDTEFLYPFISEEAADWLLRERDIKILAVDTLSPDSMNPKHGERYRVHLILLGNDRIIVETLKIPDDLPARGFRFYSVPVKYEGGTGIQVRAFAIDDSDDTSGAGVLAGVRLGALLVFWGLFCLL